VGDSVKHRLLLSNVHRRTETLAAPGFANLQYTMSSNGDHANHHQITKLSHSINAIGPAPHWGGRNREHRSIVFATITHIPSVHQATML
jgi:hypothetical protein